MPRRRHRPRASREDRHDGGPVRRWIEVVDHRTGRTTQRELPTVSTAQATLSFVAPFLDRFYRCEPPAVRSALWARLNDPWWERSARRGAPAPPDLVWPPFVEPVRDAAWRRAYLELQADVDEAEAQMAR